MTPHLSLFTVIDGGNRSRVVLAVIGLVLFTLLVLPGAVWAQETYKEAIPVAENPEIEKRMLALTEDLRCLVCQNESIADSRAEFSNDIRRIIRDQIKANKTDDEIIDFLVERYGDFVLYNPPMKPTTVLLWFGPLIMFMISAWILVKYLKGRRVQVQDVNLTEADQQKVAALLKEGEDATTVEQHEAEQVLTKQTQSSGAKQQENSEVSADEDKGKNI